MLIGLQTGKNPIIPDPDNAGVGSFCKIGFKALLTINFLCACIFAGALVFVFLFLHREGFIMTTTFSRTRILIECALMVAIGTILAQIKIVDMPFGGSITLLSMLPFILVSFRHGVKWGLLAGFANSLLQMLTGISAPPAGTVFAFIGMVLLDYILAFTLLGLAAWFAKYFDNKFIGVCVGTACCIALRFVCSFLSGFLLWSSYQSYYEWANGMNAALYSLVYNSNYMLPELFITTLAVAILYKSAPKIFSCT